jgi:PucR-like helix-turn-helix protein
MRPIPMENAMISRFVELTAAAAELGIHPQTLRRRLRAAGRSLWTDPGDLRRRLVRVEDLDLLKTPMPSGVRAQLAEAPMQAA